MDEVLEAMEHAHYVHDVGHVILDNLQFMTSGQGKGYERYGLTEPARIWRYCIKRLSRCRNASYVWRPTGSRSTTERCTCCAPLRRAATCT